MGKILGRVTNILKKQFLRKINLVLIVISLIVFLYALIGFLASSRPHAPFQQKAAEDQMMIYKGQLVRGSLTVEQAMVRRNTLLRQILSNPQGVMQSGLLLTEGEIKTLKTQNSAYLQEMQRKGYVEEYIPQGTGTYMVHHADTFEDKSLDTPMIQPDSAVQRNNQNTTYQLVIQNRSTLPKSGSRITFSNSLVIDNVLYAGQMDARDQQQEQVLGEATDATENENTLEYLVIPFYFEEDDPVTFEPPFSREDIERELFDTGNPASTSKFYEQGSWGQVHITGTVLDWIQIPASKYLVWLIRDDCAHDWWSEIADRELRRMGDYSRYKKRIYVFPRNVNCRNWAGMANQNGEKVWVNGFNESSVYTHEIGHNLGLSHAKQILCGDLSIDNYENCQFVEYGNQFDSMGNSWRNGQFNSVFKRRLQWLPDAYRSREIVSDGDYMITSSDNIPSTIALSSDISAHILDNERKIYQIKKQDTDEWYYIELRSVGAFDQTPPHNAVMINLLHNETVLHYETTYLINPQPTVKDKKHSYLEENDFFYDSINKILVRVIDINSSRAHFRVSFNVQTPPPTPTLQPTPLPTLSPFQTSVPTRQPTPIPSPTPTSTPIPTPTPTPVIGLRLELTFNEPWLESPSEMSDSIRAFFLELRENNLGENRLVSHTPVFFEEADNNGVFPFVESYPYHYIYNTRIIPHKTYRLYIGLTNRYSYYISGIRRGVDVDVFADGVLLPKLALPKNNYNMRAPYVESYVEFEGATSLTVSMRIWKQQVVQKSSLAGAICPPYYCEGAALCHPDFTYEWKTLNQNCAYCSAGTWLENMPVERCR